MSVVSCTDLSGKKLPRQVGVGITVTSGSLNGVAFNVLAQNARDMHTIPTLGSIFHISITPTTIRTLTPVAD